MLKRRFINQGFICFKQWKEAQQQQYDKDDENKNKKKKITYSKRRFINLEGAENKPNKHLYTLPSDPYGASERVTQLLKVEGINQAIEFVTHLPLDLQLTVVWNQLLGYCSKHGLDKLSKTIFVQMRKRGIEPNERTFSHLLSTLSKSNSPTSVTRAEEWIEKMYFQYHIIPTAHHFNILLNCYINNEKYNQVVARVRQMIRDHSKDINEIDDEQLLLPLPDQITLTTALNICPLIQNQPLKETRRIYHHILYRLNHQLEKQENKSNVNNNNGNGNDNNRTTMTASKLQEKALKLMEHDATLLNDQKELILSAPSSLKKKQNDLEPLDVDDGLIAALLKCLSKLYSQQYQPLKRTDNLFTKELAISFGHEIMDQFYDIQLNSRSSPSSKFGLQPTVKTLDSIVRYFGTLRQFKLGEGYYHAILKSYPNVIPDKQAQDALAWMKSNNRKYNRKIDT
ncbi:unnamed protein product [Cunninghamella blakesleeana]